MARLEDKISPSALLLAVRSGRLKDEIVREYKTSEEELAMMLLPLYRSGDLSKQEFNRFFRGVPISEETQAVSNNIEEEPIVREKAPQARPKARQPIDHNDPPSEIFKAFSNVFSRKSAKEETDSVQSEPQEISTPEEIQDEPSVDEIEALTLDDLSDNRSLRIDQEELERLEQEETERVGAFSVEVPGPDEIDFDNEESKDQIVEINRTLESIQKRLDKIEKKLGIS